MGERDPITHSDDAALRQAVERIKNAIERDRLLRLSEFHRLLAMGKE